ncbi:helix-turn-helix domain-containing protein [Kribbella sp. NPDC051620]|uniref:AraC-like ligand-binding domain-containing protein n=1 Tax=Kribbella sp. NPDC051620 TaxID=3364120 RepID=UPI0037B5B995
MVSIVNREGESSDLLESELWCHAVETQFGGVETTLAESEGLPWGALSGNQLGVVGAFQMSGPPQVFRRSASAIKRFQIDLLKVCIQLTGRAVLHQDGREIELGPGDLAIYDTARPYEMRLDGTWSCEVLTLPRTSLALPWRAVALAMERAFRTDVGAGAVLTNLVSAMTVHPPLQHERAAAEMGDAGLHLLAGTLVQDGSVLRADPIDDIRLRVMAYIRNRLSDPQLTHASVASAHHLSPRSLDRLFAEEPYTVVGYIRHLRLAAVHRELSDPVAFPSSISGIAARWGFHNPAHFARIFKDTYGKSASQVRSEGLQASS